MLWVGVIGLTMLAGCTFPQTPTPLPICDSTHLQPAMVTSPLPDEVLTTYSPTITWAYPDSTCRPARYRIHLERGPVFTTLYDVEVSGTTTSWTPPQPLPPLSTFRLGVYPESATGSRVGGLVFVFFTGPLCDDPDHLLAPRLLSPLGTAYDPRGEEGLRWEYPGDCLPPSYRIDVSTSADFRDIGLNGGTGTPGTVWSPHPNLTACQQYYWRVAAVMDTSDGRTVLGPYSEVGTFIAVPAGSQCGPPAERGAITGMVWHDLCALPDGPLPDPLPQGCVPTADGSAHADGVYQPGEPGIAGVEVGLHANNDCNSPPSALAVTDANGRFHFDNLAPGGYCLTVDALATVNSPILIPGEWTFPAGAGHVATQTTSVGANETATVNFGWDYQFLPPYESPTMTPMPIVTLPPTPTFAPPPPTPTPPLMPSPRPSPTPDTVRPQVWGVTASEEVIKWPECEPSAVRFTAHATDAGGLVEVEILYRVVRGGVEGQWEGKQMSLQQGNLYAGTLTAADLPLSLDPPVNASSAAYLEYYIIAEDHASNLGQAPSGGQGYRLPVVLCTVVR